MENVQYHSNNSSYYHFITTFAKIEGIWSAKLFAINCDFHILHCCRQSWVLENKLENYSIWYLYYDDDAERRQELNFKPWPNHKKHLSMHLANEIFASIEKQRREMYFSDCIRSSHRFLQKKDSCKGSQASKTFQRTIQWLPRVDTGIYAGGRGVFRARRSHVNEV